MKLLKRLSVFILAFLPGLSLFADADNTNNIGQTIEIHTRFNAFVGRPSWLLVIRDIDHNQNIPYLFTVERGENVWLAYTFGRNYLITASTLQINTYQPWCNTYRHFKTRNFCYLQSFGHIERGTSLRIDITGNLSPNSDTYQCQIMRFTDPNFYIAKPDA